MSLAPHRIDLTEFAPPVLRTVVPPARRSSRIGKPALASAPWVLPTACAALVGLGLALSLPAAAPDVMTLASAHVLLWPVWRRADDNLDLLHRPSQTAELLLAASTRALLTLAALAWFIGASTPVPVLVTLVAGTALLDAGCQALRAVVHRHSRPRRVLLAGHARAAETLTAELDRIGGGRLNVVGRCPATLAEVAGEACRTGADDVVLLSCHHLSPNRVRHLAWRLADQGRQLHLAPGLIGFGGTRTRLEAREGLTLVTLAHSELRSLRRSALQWAGRASALVLLIALLPLLLAVALAVRLDSPGPVLFRQRRVGASGRRFRMVKFRTMTDRITRLPCDADRFLYKVKQDPRITRVGAVLRRYSIDELPQLINVVRGEMALVGPRPALPEETDRYEDDVHRRLAVRPGMTGLWQVSGRSDLSWEETVRLDLDYVDNWTPSLDLRILLRTVGAVLGHRGAY